MTEESDLEFFAREISAGLGVSVADVMEANPIRDFDFYDDPGGLLAISPELYQTMLNDHGYSMLNLNLTYKVSDIIEKAKANRDKHVREFKEALIAYRAAVKRECLYKIRKIKANQDFHDGSAISKPQNHSEEYDRALQMLSLTTEKEITLTPDLFRQLMLDQWAWSSTLVGAQAYNSRTWK